jgi:hypothetical protein
VIQTVISVVKQIAVGALKGLDGLTSMKPGGDFLKGLNATISVNGDYSALASNYEPGNGGLADSVLDAFADALFKAENDLVVPTGGVGEANGSPLLPAERLHTFPGTDSIEHTRYFKNPVAQAKLTEWMTADQ